MILHHIQYASFEARVRKELGLADATPFPGFYRYKDVLRDALLQRGFVKGLGAIPTKKKFIRNQPCEIEHPGICATRHRRFMPQLVAADKSLFAILKEQRWDTYWHLHARGRKTQADQVGSHDESMWFHYAWCRGANPKVCVLGRAAFDPHTRIVQLCDLEDGFDYLPAKSILGSVFRAGGDAEIVIDYIHLSPAPQQPLGCDFARRRWDRIALLDDFEAQMRNAEKQIFPPRILPAASLTARVWIDARLVSGLDGLKSARVKRGPGRPSGVCTRPPQRADDIGAADNYF